MGNNRDKDIKQVGHKIKIHFQLPIVKDELSGNDETPTTKWVINDTSLLLEGVTPTNGRFTLYSTDNIYNFLLLDREDGDIWQLQLTCPHKLVQVES